MVELRQVLDLARVVAGLAVPQLADGAEGVLVGQAVREDVRERQQRRRVELQRVLLQLLRQLVELGQRTARDRGPAELRQRRDRVEPGARVVVVRPEPSLCTAIVSSRVLVTTPSAMKYAVSVGVISMVARRMMPVRPMPPTVAQNSLELRPWG